MGVSFLPIFIPHTSSTCVVWHRDIKIHSIFLYFEIISLFLTHVKRVGRYLS